MLRASSSGIGRLAASASSSCCAIASRTFTRALANYSLAQHQWRAEKQAGRVPNKFAFTRGKPRVDKKFAECERAWILVDAYGEPLGRLASKIAQLLVGKHKPIFAHKRDVSRRTLGTHARRGPTPAPLPRTPARRCARR